MERQRRDIRAHADTVALSSSLEWARARWNGDIIERWVDGNWRNYRRGDVVESGGRGAAGVTCKGTHASIKARVGNVLVLLGSRGSATLHGGAIGSIRIGAARGTERPPRDLSNGGVNGTCSRLAVGIAGTYRRRRRPVQPGQHRSRRRRVNDVAS